MKLNGTTLYRQQGYNNQLERLEEYGEERTYDSGVYGYDYGFEDGDYFLDYDGFEGLKGDPGPPVSVSVIILYFMCVCVCMSKWCFFFFSKPSKGKQEQISV